MTALAKATVYFVYCVAVERSRSLTSRLFCALLCACVLSACAASSNQSPPPGAAVVEAPDFNKQGGTWTYRVVHNMASGGYRSDMDYGDIELRIRNGNYQRRRVDGDKRPLGSATWLYAALPTPKIIEDKARYFNFPLWIGKEWDGAQFITHRWRDAHSTVTGIETVVTPGGTFEAYRIERKMVTFAGILNYYGTEVYFYSPQTRSIVKFDFKLEMKDLVGDAQYGLQETASFELLSYKPGPESSEVKKASAH